jgi:hypothetical protein
MAKVNLVSKKITMDLWNTIKFQLLTHGYIQGIPLSESELNCLTLLGINKESELSDFCNASCSEEQRDKEPALEYKSHIFKNPQTVRNCLSKLEKLGFITKEGKNRKKIFLSENLKIQILGNIVLDYKVICLDTKKI